MSRRSSGGRSARLATHPAKRPPSQPAPNAPASVPARGFLGNLADNRVVDAVVGPRRIRYETVASPTKAGSDDACSVHVKAFQDCLNGYGDEISKCQVYMNMLAECKRNSGSMMSS